MGSVEKMVGKCLSCLFKNSIPGRSGFTGLARRWKVSVSNAFVYVDGLKYQADQRYLGGLGRQGLMCGAARDWDLAPSLPSTSDFEAFPSSHQ
jgi:hypothetical protein